MMTSHNKHNTFGRGFETRAINGGLDKYYTNTDIAEECLRFLADCIGGIDKGALMLEPAAGAGVFLDAVDTVLELENIGYDIEPGREDVIKADFLLDITEDLKPKTIVFGNPPFGFAGNSAIRFMNHAADIGAAAIAFILPKTFKKMSMQRRVHPLFHLIGEMNIPAEAYTVDGKAHSVPSVFQVWVRLDEPRDQDEYTLENPWIGFVKKGDGQAKFMIRRVGGKAGAVIYSLDGSASSNYFAYEKVPGARELFSSLDLSSVINSTAGVRSISKREIHAALAGAYHGK